MTILSLVIADKQIEQFPSHLLKSLHLIHYIDGLAQNCSNSIANALELLQSCAKPSIWNNDEEDGM